MFLSKLLESFKRKFSERSDSQSAKITIDDGHCTISKKLSSKGPLICTLSSTQNITPDEVQQLNDMRVAFSNSLAVQNAFKNVVYIFAIELLGQQGHEQKKIKDLQKLYDLYEPQLQNKVEYILGWISDIYVEIRDPQTALKCFPRLNINSRSSCQTDKLLSLKYALNQDIDVPDIFTLFGPQVTKWGRNNIDLVSRYIDIQLCEIKKRCDKTLLAEWAPNTYASGYSIYSGSIYSSDVNGLKSYCFSNNKTVEKFIRELTREAENTAREEFGIPKVGQGWIAETELYYKIKEHFKELVVVQHGRPKWLGKQHVDIYIPSMNVAIEYQGQQHDMPVEYFGGQESFKKLKRLDNKKAKLCIKHGIVLIYVRPGYRLEALIDEISTASKNRKSQKK